MRTGKVLARYPIIGYSKLTSPHEVMSTNTQIFSLAELGRRLNLPTSRLRQLVAMGKLPPDYQCGGKWYYSAESLERIRRDLEDQQLIRK